MRRFMVLVTVLGLVGAAFVFPVVGAGAGTGPAPDKTATIKKVAVNAPPGTKFTIHLACNTAEIFVPGDGGATTDELDFAFTVNAAGEAVPDGTNTVTFEGGTPCSVTETASGGATTTSYECADNLAALANGTDTVDPASIIKPPDTFCTTFGPQADPIKFDINFAGEAVTVTVTNTFPVVAPAVVAPVTFTG
ncbi:MAG: hypothetical protein MUP97_13525 [Acidimicrobiia bacterium]|nr:hypothetical protein [Acidimicrobiia bacterium]